MADGLLGGGGADLWRSRILGSALEDTPYQQQAVAGMLGGATPEQLQSFFGSPDVQKQFQAFGINPQQFTQNIRQSPFLPNQFMQQHPLMGGMLTHALANAAATPEAPLVSGAGSGISRAAQGMYGGPEMLRQYQLHQMMAPFGMMAGMMPTYGEQRRRAIEEAIVEETRKRMQMLPQQQQMQEGLLDVKRMLAEAAQTKAEGAADAAHRPQVHFGPIGTGIETVQDVPYRAAGELGARQMTDPLRPGQQIQMPGQVPTAEDPLTFGLSPEQQAGWNLQYTPYDAAAMQTQFAAKAAGSQTPEKGALLTAQAHEAESKGHEAEAKGRAAETLARIKGEKEADYTKWSAQFNKERDEWFKRDQRYKELEAGGTITKEQADKMRADNDANFEQAKKTIDDGRRATGGPGASTPWKRGQVPPQVAPGGSPGSAQAGGPGAQKSQGTAVAPNQTGLPPGMVFDENGIPRMAPQQAPRP